MLDNILEVYETDADLSTEPQNLKYQGFHRDMAETKMILLFRSSGYDKDYLLYNRTKQEVLMACLSTQTRNRRGECQA